MSNKLRQKIILVDDDPSFLTRIVSLLGNDYDCHTASTGSNGVFLHQQLLNHKPLVVCDVNLPDISGFEVCQQIKMTDSQTRVLLLTMYNDSVSRMRGLRAYADQYIDKLVGEEELKLLIRNACLTIAGQTIKQEVLNRLDDDLSTTDFETRVRSLILAHYNQLRSHRTVWECSSQSVAEKMNMAYRTFQREIKNRTGYSFKQLHLIVRLEKSKELLDLGYNVSQVADYLSFSNPAHLSRSFKTQFGLTPSNYKQHGLFDRHHQKPSKRGIIRTQPRI